MSRYLPKPPSNPKSINLGMQDMHIQHKFPNFKLRKKGTKYYWLGYLRPTSSSAVYTIKLIYHTYSPKVYVLEPEILKFAPHRYNDHSLCLYHPNDESFNGGKLIADTIIPWTSEWLYFYEKWLEEGVWWGLEAPHSLL